VLRNRDPKLVRLYEAIEAYVKSLGPVEVVTRERYVLFRSVRIFSDLVLMTDAVRIAIHLSCKAAHPIFFKIGSDDKTVTHVAKLRTARDFTVVKPYIKEAYARSLARP
jgi:hypothetical protein